MIKNNTLDPKLIFEELFSFGISSLSNINPMNLFHFIGYSHKGILRALHILDSIPVKETLKIGLVYIRADQINELDILDNSYGSIRYKNFLHNLGTFILLKNANTFTAGLDRKTDRDGKYTIIKTTHMTEICYHIATLMPSTSNLAKKRHIGNDAVLIIYKEQDSYYDINHSLPSQQKFYTNYY